MQYSVIAGVIKVAIILYLFACMINIIHGHFFGIVPVNTTGYKRSILLEL